MIAVFGVVAAIRSDRRAREQAAQLEALRTRLDVLELAVRTGLGRGGAVVDALLPGAGRLAPAAGAPATGVPVATATGAPAAPATGVPVAPPLGAGVPPILLPPLPGAAPAADPAAAGIPGATGPLGAAPAAGIPGATGPAAAGPAGPVADGPSADSPHPDGPHPDGPAPSASPHPDGTAPTGPTGPAAAPPPPRPPRPSISIETVAVWVAASLGALMLVVAVLFGLQLAIRAGYFGPPLRFATGVGTGILALLLGEVLWSRRYHVPSAALTGGGAAVLFAALYAGHARYGLYPNGVAMGAMVATVVVTMFAAERRNLLLLALLAMAGGYMAPILLSTGENKAAAFFAYLALLDAGALWAARRRQWWAVPGLAAFVTGALHLGWGATFRAPDQVPVALAGATVFALLFTAAASGKVPAPRPSSLKLPPELTQLAAGLGAAFLWLVGLPFVIPADPLRSDPRSGLPLPWPDPGNVWLALGFVALAAFVSALLSARRGSHLLRGAGVLVAAALLLALAVGWTLVDSPPMPAVALATLLLPAARLVAMGLSGPLRLAPKDGEPAPFGGAEGLRIAGLGEAVAALCLPAVVWATAVSPHQPEAPWPELVAVGLAGMGVIAGRLSAARLLLPLVPVLAAVVLTPWAQVRAEDGHAGLLAAAAAFTYALAVWPAVFRPRLKDLGGNLGAGLAGVVLFRVFYVAWVAVLGDSFVGGLAVLLGAHTLLAALALLRVARARRDSGELAAMVALTLLAAAIAIPLQVQEAWLTVGWAIEVAALAWLSRRLTHPAIVGFAVVLGAAVAVRLLANPEVLHYGDTKGWVILNWTLWTWGVPAVCFLFAARWLQGWPVLPRAFRITSVGLFFALVNLQVAHAFARDDELSFTSENLAESMTRSISWGLFGLVILVIGFVRNSRLARLGGFAFTLLAAAKVCLVDVMNLSAAVRVGAFAGLAPILLLSAILFQRVVMRERERPADPGGS